MFDFVPQVIWIYGYYSTNIFYIIASSDGSSRDMRNILPTAQLTPTWNTNYGIGWGQYTARTASKKSNDGKTISWYTMDEGPSNQLNQTETTYCYIAIG